MSDAQISLEMEDARPLTPLQERMLPQSHLSMNSDGHLPFQPGTPESIGSHYAGYDRTMTSPGEPRLPSPASSSRSYTASGSVSSPVFSLPPYLHVQGGQIQRIKKHTKKKLDGLDKKRICLYHANHSNARQEDIAELFGVERSTVSKILKNKEEWLNVDENAVPAVKYRPSKFPIVEALMANWLQECLDRDVPITDSSIRQKALEAANTSGVPREKFKASSGWIENFKHRHEIRGGKWTAGTKNAPTVDNNENPGLYGGPRDTVISFNRPTGVANSSDSSMQSSRDASPEPGSPADAANGNMPFRRSRESSERGPSHQGSSSWHSSSNRGIGSLVDRNLPSPLYGSSRDPVEDEETQTSPQAADGSSEVETILYLPSAYPSAHHQVDDYSKLPGQRGPPTIHDAEQAVEVLMTFLDNAPEKLIPRVITSDERDVLRHIKTQLCRITLGMPLSSRKNS